MSAKEFLVQPKQAPSLNVPPSSSTVTVRVIDRDVLILSMYSTSEIGIPTKLIVAEKIKGHDMIVCPSYAFLITNGDRNVLFDLGVRKDWRNLPRRVVDLVDKGDWTLKVPRGVGEILDDSSTSVGITSKDIDTVIWSHHHWDHVGNMSEFPKSTNLMVGPGLIAEYTGKEDSVITPEYYEGRSFSEVDFERDGKGVSIGGCEAIDFFGDGSFYLLNAPGHTIGHICGFARVSTSPDSFVFMGGDASHHCGEFRPTQWHPLPAHITPSPIPHIMAHSCPGELLQQIQRNKRADEPYYTPAEGFNMHDEDAKATISKLEVFDGVDNVMMILSHDSSLWDQLPYYPKTINDWHQNKLDEKTRWLFTKDFADAIAEANHAKL